MAEISMESGLPRGVFNVINGDGLSAGQPLVDSKKVKVLSFTGSTHVGRLIASKAGDRLCRVSLELGGKNSFIVCSDADIDQAVKWALLSAFSNAGQRCSAAGRLIIEEAVYDEFKDKFLLGVQKLKLGIDEGCDLGPVITKKHQDYLLEVINRNLKAGAILLHGSSDRLNKNGFYIEPTVIEGLDINSDLAAEEYFGPIVNIYKAKNLQHALEMSANNEYGLTLAIHTRNVDKAIWFAHQANVGVININIGTYGSEPHMPFGGFGASGNGSREPGVEALDVYSELKNISIMVREDGLFS